MQQQPSQLTPVAVFDYDGTCISGQSGKLIATWLFKNGYLSFRGMYSLAMWGARYTLHIPHREELAREVIFHDLNIYSPQEVEDIMAAFHRKVLVPRYRSRAMGEVARRKAEGCVTLLVSATFEAIAHDAAAYLGTDGFVATEMEQDEQGYYTGRVLGDVIEGEAKVAAAQAWADKALGKGKWYLAYAYGDHHSDMMLLESATHPIAVSPDLTLRRVARKNGWDMSDWKSR